MLTLARTIKLPLELHFEGLMNGGDWYPVFTLEETEKPVEYRFDYAPTRDLNDNLKGLANAN